MRGTGGEKETVSRSDKLGRRNSKRWAKEVTQMQGVVSNQNEVIVFVARQEMSSSP